MTSCPTPRKRPFSSRRAAKASLSEGDRKFLVPYLCPTGFHWHLTSRRHAKPPWERKRAA